jgi:hypothetical protein
LIVSEPPYYYEYIKQNDITLTFPPWRLCRKSVHGSTGSPRTENSTLKINYLAVRPELVEGETADYDTASRRRKRWGGKAEFQ